MENKVIISHMGKTFQKNIQGLISKSIKLKADFVELDIRATKDNINVVYHDAKIEGKFIKNRTYSQLNEIANKENFEIFKLKSVIQKFSKKIKFNLHIKKQTENSLKELIRIIPNDCVVSSEHVGILQRIQKEKPQIKLAYIFTEKTDCFF